MGKEVHEPKGERDNKSVLDQVMVWHQRVGKFLSELKINQFIDPYTHQKTSIS